MEVSTIERRLILRKRGCSVRSGGLYPNTGGQPKQATIAEASVTTTEGASAAGCTDMEVFHDVAYVARHGSPVASSSSDRSPAVTSSPAGPGAGHVPAALGVTVANHQPLFVVVQLVEKGMADP